MEAYKSEIKYTKYMGELWGGIHEDLKKLYRVITAPHCPS